METKKGFDRLRGLAAAGMMGLGALAGGSARAASSATRLTVTKSFASTTAWWSSIGNASGLFSDSTRTTTNGFVITTSMSAFGISDGKLTTPGFSGYDAFDQALTLAVGNTLFVNPGGVVDITGDTLTTGTVTDITSGIDATIQYYFSPSRPVVRALYTLTNTTGTAISTNVLVSGNYGSDSNTTVEATQSGDTTIDGNDKWYVTDDTGLGDPVVTTTRYGTGAAVIPTNALTPGGASNSEDYGLRYAVTVPANGTIRVMVFHEMGATAAANAAAAADFESLSALSSAGLLTGLTDTQIGQIVNYTSPTTNNSGGGGALGVLGGLGLLALYRRRRGQEKKR